MAAEFPAPSEGQLVDTAGGNTVRPPVRARLPERGLAVVFVQQFEVSNTVARVGRAHRESVAHASREVELDTVRRLPAERQIRKAHGGVLRVRPAKQPLQ